MPAVDVTPGTTVLWTNADTVAHTVTSGTPDTKFDTEVPAGGTFSFTFRDAGAYQYFCCIHPSMTATVNVGSGGGTPGSESTSRPTPAGSGDDGY